MIDFDLGQDNRSFLLTWHGHVVCRNKSGCLFPASLDAVAAGHMQPLLITDDDSFIDPPPFIVPVPPLESAPVHSISLGCRQKFVSCINQTHFELADGLTLQEHFLPINLN